MKVTPYKGRAVEYGQTVQVYRNLHNGKWSVRDADTGLVLAHADEIVLVDPRFEVREAGRQRFARELVKNVHAWVEGRVARFPEQSATWNLVGYNPYTTDRFIDVMGKTVEAAQWAWLESGALFVPQEVA